MLLDSINSFSGYYAFLSNFYSSKIQDGDFVFDTVEHAYQAAKTTTEEDFLFVKNAKTPAEAKNRGRLIECRSDWDDVKDEVMLYYARLKFEQNLDLRQKLLDTDNKKLVEGNHWGDMYWGVFRDKGRNQLGLTLMKVREELRAKTV